MGHLRAKSEGCGRAVRGGSGGGPLREGGKEEGEGGAGARSAAPPLTTLVEQLRAKGLGAGRCCEEGTPP